MKPIYRELSSTINFRGRVKFDPAKHLQNSKLGTYHFQNALPKLPIPTLEETSRRIIRSVEALEGHPSFTQEHIAEFKKQWKSFESIQAPILDKLLREEDNNNKHTNFVNEPWTDQYLSDRRALPLNYNPAVVLTDASQVVVRPSQLQRITQIMYSVAKYNLTLEHQLLHPDVIHLKGAPSKNTMLLAKWLPNLKVSIKSKGIENQALRYIPFAMNMSFPLDMGQFKNLVFSTRIPAHGKDYIQKAPANSRHVAVLYKGRVYRVDAYDESMVPREPALILADLEAIEKDGNERGWTTTPVCALSSNTRDVWATNREHLIKIGNSDALDAIDHAMICVALDDSASYSAGDLLKRHVAGPAQNRWPDKSFSVVIGHDIAAGVVFEHAWGDGAAVLHLMNSIDRHTIDLLSKKIDGPDVSRDGLKSRGVGVCNEVIFKVDDKIVDEIKKAVAFHENISETFAVELISGGEAPATYNPFFWDQDGEDLKRIRENKVNRLWMKKHKLGPDGFLQLGLQMAMYRLKGHPSSVYESASTSMFKDGRTETIRPCTMEAVNVAKMLDSVDKNDVKSCKEFIDAMRVSIKAHNNQTKNCLGGHGWDRYIFGLKTQAAKHKIQLHPVFETEAMVNISDFTLSTSTLNSDYVSLGGFGPVGRVNPDTGKPNGYGVGYCLFNNWVGCGISGYPENGYDPIDYKHALKKVWDDLVVITEKSAE